MLLKYFYDSYLAHASYFVGCQRTGEAVVIDAGRDITPYLETAVKEGMKIVGAADTHIHADYVSGARELADRVGATLYVSDEGDENWKYEYVGGYQHRLLKDGDTFAVGKVELKVMYTPGHTPEHICFVLTDRGGGADRPMGVFSGDFVFVGSIGRPDLLEKAAGVKGTAVPGAYQVYDSLQKFKQLPDYLQLWPAHGAGSACGKGLGSVPSSTVGYEKLFNPMLQIEQASEFVESLLDGQPEAPRYFAVMKRVNKVGPRVLGGYQPLPKQTADLLTSLLADGHQVVDLRAGKKFAAAHVPGTLNIPFGNLGEWAGWMVDYKWPLYLIATADEVETAWKILTKVGIDDIAGYFETSEVAAAGLMNESYREVPAAEIAEKMLRGEVVTIDVRAQTEWDEGHIPGARHIMLGYLDQHVVEFVKSKPIVLQCRSGNRSAMAASLLQARGIKNVVNLAGGIRDWVAAGLPVE